MSTSEIMALMPKAKEVLACFMREPIKDKMRLKHILGAIDVLLEGKKRHDFEQAIKDPIVFFEFEN